MLTTRDPRVQANINLHAVFGALPKLAQLVPEARDILAALAAPVTLTLQCPGIPKAIYTFTPAGTIRPGGGGKHVRLIFTSPAHVNKVVDGKAQPVPVAGPKGLTFLTKVFTPLTDLLGRYLQPSDADLQDPEFVATSTLLTFEVVAEAVTIVGNEDESGRVSADHMPDGAIDFEIGDEYRYRIRVSATRLRRDPDPIGTPTAALRFSDLKLAGDVLSGRASSLASVANGSLAMRGMIPLVDNTNRLLDRVGAYLGA